MKKNSVTTDVDIDVFDRDKVLKSLPHADAVIKQDDGTFRKHNTGVYFQPIPKDPFTNLSDLDYKEAEDLGYFKLDFLNVHVYEHVRDEEHLIKLMETEPHWELLDHEEFVSKLFHISKYPELLQKLRPRSIEDLAAVLAIIRPSKRYLEEEPWDYIRKEVWTKPKDGKYHFKKGHAIAYASVIAVQMNLIIESLTQIN